MILWIYASKTVLSGAQGFNIMTMSFIIKNQYVKPLFEDKCFPQTTNIFGRPLFFQSLEHKKETISNALFAMKYRRNKTITVSIP